MSLTVVQSFRFCHKCQTLFYEGRYEPASVAKGLCPAGGAHEAMGYTFQIPAHGVESPTVQTRWRFCRSCWAMFFDGYSSKGICPGNRHGHRRESRFGHNFGLPHSIPGTPTAQTQWRFCNKCSAMFYDGYAKKGRCSSGGEHFGQGYDFVLPHIRP